MAENKDHLWKSPEEAQEKIEDLVKGGSHPVGIDVGTSKVVVSRRSGKDMASAAQLNAFIPVPYSPLTEKTIQQQSDIHYYRDGDEIIIYGTATERFANMFNAEARRPMADGMLNPKEKPARPVLEAIVQSLVPKARSSSEILAFSVPAAVAGHEAELTYHEASLRRYFTSLGYKAMAINEGLAVIFSELEDHNFTGIGVSCGGGMCNATLAFLSIPTIMFSLAQGRRLHRPLGRRGGGRARHAREGHQGGGPRPLQEPEGQDGEGPPHLLRGPRGDAGRHPAPVDRPRGEAAPDRAGAAHRARGRDGQAQGVPRAVRADASRAGASRSRWPRCAWPRTRSPPPRGALTSRRCSRSR